MQQQRHSTTIAFQRPSSAQMRMLGIPVDEQAPDGPPPVVAPASAHADTILLVEPDDVTRRAAKRALQRFGYVIIEAEDGEDALMMLEQREEPIDLIVCDVAQPNISGLELYQAVRATSPVRFLLSTDAPPAQVRASAGIELDAEFLEKPFTVPELAVKVLEALD